MNEKDKAIVQALASIQNRLRHVYNQGFEDGRKAERKTGKWIEKNGMYICTACEQRLSKLAVYDVGGIYNYCPFCGAKMEVDE